MKNELTMRELMKVFSLFIYYKRWEEKVLPEVLMGLYEDEDDTKYFITIEEDYWSLSSKSKITNCQFDSTEIGGPLSADLLEEIQDLLNKRAKE